MATSVSIIVWDYGTDFITVKFRADVTWAATYKVTYGIYETGEERTSGDFTLDAGGSYTTQTAKFSGLNPDTGYTVWVSLWNAGTDTELGVTAEEEIWTESLPTPPEPVRPDDWEWYSTVSKGAAMDFAKISDTEYEVYPLTAAEWNDFVDRVVEFAEYCGLSVPSNYGSSWYVTRGTEMSATEVNYMRTLIGTLPIAVSLPVAATSNRSITAAYINGLKNSLNSIE